MIMNYKNRENQLKKHIDTYVYQLQLDFVGTPKLLYFNYDIKNVSLGRAKIKCGTRDSFTEITEQRW